MRKIKVFASLAIALCFGFASVAEASTLNRQLEFGMSGSDVSALQIFLAKDPTLYPQGLITGYFGLFTKSAVTNFQIRNGISAVGRVGPITLAVLNLQMDGQVGFGADKTSPVIYMPVSVMSVGSSNYPYNGSTSVALSWATNEASSAVVYYSPTTIPMLEAGPFTGVTIGGISVVAHTDLRTAHSVTINGLMPNTNYNYVVYVSDASGNETVTLPATFRTGM